MRFLRGKFLILCLFSFALGFSDSIPNVDIFARSAGLANVACGYTGTARSSSVFAPYWNPAALYLVTKPELGFNYYRSLGVVDNFSISGAFLSEDGLPIGLGFLQQQISNIPHTETFLGGGRQIGVFSDSNRVYNVSTAFNLGVGRRVGINAKLLHRNLHVYSASGYAVDVGYLQRVGPRSSVGVMFRNPLSALSWNSGLTETLEREVVLGATSTELFEDIPVVFSADYSINFSDSTLSYWGLGGEVWLVPESFALRGGYTSATAITLGFGYYYYDFLVDMAYVIRNKEDNLENQLMFSSTFKFQLPDNKPKDNNPSQQENSFNKVTEQKGYFDQVYLEDNNLVIELINMAEIYRIAVVSEDKGVSYLTPSENSRLVIPGQTVGEYTFFIQTKSGDIFKSQRKIF